MREWVYVKREDGLYIIDWSGGRVSASSLEDVGTIVCRLMEERFNA